MAHPTCLSPWRWPASRPDPSSCAWRRRRRWWWPSTASAWPRCSSRPSPPRPLAARGPLSPAGPAVSSSPPGSPWASVMGAMGLAIAGAGLIAAGDWAEGTNSLKGDVLALAGAVTMSLYHVIGRGLRRALPLPAYVLGVWSTAALTLAALCAVARTGIVGYAPRTYAFLLALAVVPTLGGHGLVN